jgi:hypothetical protein
MSEKEDAIDRWLSNRWSAIYRGAKSARTAGESEEDALKREIERWRASYPEAPPPPKG